jgi:hypothetical protein
VGKSGLPLLVRGCKYDDCDSGKYGKCDDWSYSS